MRGKHILIVEDHPESADALKRMITRRGGAADIVETIEDANALIRLRDAQGPKIDLIVSDLGMPDSHAEDTLLWLASLEARGFTVCAMSGIEDAEIIERAAQKNVCMILKGTSAEGIMEAIFYALMRSDPAYAPAAAKEIVENRSMVREIPFHIKAWGFFNWPKWVQVSASLTTVIVLFGTIVTGASTVVHSLEVRSVANEAGRQAALANKEIIDRSSARIDRNDQKIRSLEDDRLLIKTSLGVIEKAIEKLDGKLDSRDARVNAMWQQRLDGKTNRDLSGAGALGLPGEPPTPTPK